MSLCSAHSAFLSPSWSLGEYSNNDFDSSAETIAFSASKYSSWIIDQFKFLFKHALRNVGLFIAFAPNFLAFFHQIC